MPARTFDWNPSQHVNNIDKLAAISGKYVLLNIGVQGDKPALTITEMDAFKPIGLVQNFTVGQNKMSQRVFEVGSEKSFIVTGPTVANFSATRLLVMGPTLVGILKHGVTNTDPDRYDPAYFKFDIADKLLDRPFVFVLLFYAPTVQQNIEEELGTFSASNAITSNEIAGAVALEYCVLTTQSFGVNAGDVVIFENVTFEAGKVVDLDVSFTPKAATTGIDSLSRSGINYA